MKTKLWVIMGILIIAGAAMVMPVMAVDSGSTQITGNAVPTIDITVTGSLAGWQLTPPSSTNNGATLTVNTNVASGWHVKVADSMTGKATGSDGKMQEAVSAGGAYVASGAVLQSPLTVSAPGDTASTSDGTKTLTASPTAIIDGTAATSTYSQSLLFTQPVSYTLDPVLTGGHVYQIVVAFTGTPS